MVTVIIDFDLDPSQLSNSEVLITPRNDKIGLSVRGNRLSPRRNTAVSPADALGENLHYSLSKSFGSSTFSFKPRAP